MQTLMKTFWSIILFVLLLSCSKTGDLTSENPLNESESTLNGSKSTLIELEYPTQMGNSGDTLISVLGYGYDATGMYDTFSVKAKVLNLHNQEHLGTGKPGTAGPGVQISGSGFNSFMEAFNNPHKLSESNVALQSHIKSLLKLAGKSDSINLNSAYAYYSYQILYSTAYYYINYSDIDSEITPDFKSDVTTLSPDQIVNKYGTHVLTHVYTGARLEALYKCDLNLKNAYGAEQGLYKRMKQYFGKVPGILIYDESGGYTQKNEQLIYNVIGSKTKLFGLINASDYNPDNIHIDIDSIFGDNVRCQFIGIGQEGLVPIYELVNDSVKKQELKNYIDQFISE